MRKKKNKESDDDGDGSKMEEGSSERTTRSRVVVVVMGSNTKSGENSRDGKEKCERGDERNMDGCSTDEHTKGQDHGHQGAKTR